MANLKELRSRIKSVSSTMQITSAMKMVSASKLSKAQDAIQSMRPYSEKLTELLGALSASVGANVSNSLTKQREINKVLVVSISSNRGLAGAFNSNIVKASKKLVSEELADKQVDFLLLVRKHMIFYLKNFLFLKIMLIFLMILFSIRLLILPRD